MKLIISWAIIVFAGQAAAQSSCTALATLVPACASSCIESAATVVGCATNDYNCQCIPASSNSIVIDALACVTNACGLVTGLAAKNSAGAVCSCITAAESSTSSTVTNTATTSSTKSTSTSSLSPGSSVTPTSPTSTSTSTSSTSSSSTSKSSSSAPSNSTTTTSTSQSSSSSTSSTGPITVCASASPCAASLAAIPSCGVPCLAAAGSSVGCSSADQACQCSHSASIQAGAAACVVSSCTAPLAVLTAANSLCACVSAHPTTPCSSSTSTTSTISTNSSSTSTSKSSTSSTSSSSNSTSSTSKISSSSSSLNSTTSASKTSSPTSKTSSSTSKTSSSSSPITSGPSTSLCVSKPNCGPSASAIPSCALSCFSSAILSDSPCGISDYGCQCVKSTYAVISAAVVPCVISDCPVSTLLAVVNAANAVCSCASSTVTTPCPMTSTSNPGCIVTVTKTSSASVIAPTCNHDNCLRQMIRSPAQVPGFCQTYTKKVITVPTGLPDYVSHCSGSHTRISSACSCLAPPSPLPRK